MKQTIAALIKQNHALNLDHLAAIRQQASRATFVSGLLEADEPLWGGFWQFDVIAPGYKIPALELALLRATRLDKSWLGNTRPEQFLADLHATVAQPQAGIWTLNLAGVPWVVFITPVPTSPPFATVVWYCVTTSALHAGYRVSFSPAHVAGMTNQQPAGAGEESRFAAAMPGDEVAGSQVDWIATALVHSADPDRSLTARLDAAVLRWRLHSNVS